MVSFQKVRWSGAMQAITVSSKFQVSLPKALRQQLHITPGQKLFASVEDGAIRLVPVPTLDEIQGSVKGLSLKGLREKVDRV
jgi:AbrB family looped-hinge helix DNA binding protein